MRVILFLFGLLLTGAGVIFWPALFGAIVCFVFATRPKAVVVLRSRSYRPSRAYRRAYRRVPRRKDGSPRKVSLNGHLDEEFGLHNDAPTPRVWK